MSRARPPLSGKPPSGDMLEDIREEDEEGRDASATEQFLKEYF